LKNRLNKTANSTDDIEKLVENFSNSLKDIVIKELNNAGLETDDYDKNGFNMGTIVLGLATLGTYNDSAGYVNNALAEKIQESINNLIEESDKGEDNNE
jgi:hypothetical protein